MIVRLLACAATLSLLAGCATAPGQDRLAEKDPLEKINRGVWDVNMAVDKVVLKPASTVYRTVVPKPARHGVTHALWNLTEPWSFINNALQGKGKRAGTNVGRFLVNSTIGLGGLIDVASKMGMPAANEDFGQTMARWGFNGGPYLVLPILGPSTMRDGIGTGIGFYADPVNIAVDQAHVSVWYKRGYRTLQIIDGRAQLTESGGDAFLKSSLDPYAAARSAFLQRRRSQILDQENSAEAGPPDPDDAVAAPADQPQQGGATLPATSAPLPGDEPAPASAPLPASAAPLPGDDAPPPAPAAVPPHP
jgi:phospholipid-binding lipoprotein MlaA